ncbi:MAG: efflux RND transporter periplasmic adaptor subunit [Moraxellaceae bacterium]|nr:MAG: efflux RND transporter periplasmic adaptor subunit [Moraxellaceae bacterium]
MLIASLNSLPRRISLGLLAKSVLITCLLTACGSKTSDTPPPPIVEVGVIKVSVSAATIQSELPGRTTAYRVAEVRPQVTGIIQKRLFIEGAEIKAGTPLYQIDAATYQAALSTAQAELARAEANYAAAKARETRYKSLMASKAISQQDYDDALAAMGQAKANLAAGKAAVEAANINVKYTKVIAPINGVIGRSSVTEGALVSAGQTQVLTTIQQLDPVYVDISQSSADLLRLRQQIQAGQLSGADNSARVKLTLEDGSTYPVEGRLAFSGVSVDPASGAVMLRAIFANPSQLLLPGMYVTAKVVQGVNNAAMLIPQAAVTRTPQGEANVLIVNAQGIVEPRPVVTSGTQGSNWIITSGLNDGDKVIVEGIAKVKPGAPAKPVMAKADAAQPATGAQPKAAGTASTGQQVPNQQSSAQR